MECSQSLRILAGISSCDVAAYASNSSMAFMMSSLSKSMTWILRGSSWLIPTTVCLMRLEFGSLKTEQYCVWRMSAIVLG